MGSFVYMHGKPTVPEKRRGELAERMERLFNQGGMMKVNESNLLGHTVFLLSSVQYEKERIWFDYNYFEDDFWEAAAYDARDACLSSNKVSSGQFCAVLIAAYLLLEFYSDSFVVTQRDGEHVNGPAYIGWLNYLFGESYTNSRAGNLWEIYKVIRPDFEDEFDFSIADRELKHTDVEAYFTTICVHGGKVLEEFLALNAKLQSNEEHEGKPQGISVLSCYSLLKTIIGEIKEESGVSDAEELEFLKKLWAVKGEAREQLGPMEEKYTLYNFCSFLVPWQITTKLLSDAFGVGYWDLHDEMALVPRIEEAQKERLDMMRSNKKNDAKCFPVVPPEDTAAFLRCSDDDRALFWDEDGDVHFSDEMQTWLKRLKEEFDDILTGDGVLIKPMEFFGVFLQTLERINEDYRRLYFFENTFVEFISTAEKREVQAAVVLLKRLADRHTEEIPRLRRAYWGVEFKTPGRLQIKRYLAILSNVKLRKHVLGF